MLKSGMAKQAKARVQKQAEERLRETVVKKSEEGRGCGTKTGTEIRKTGSSGSGYVCPGVDCSCWWWYFRISSLSRAGFGSGNRFALSGFFAAGENDTPGTITPSAAIAQVNEEYTEKLEEIQSSFEGSYSRIETDGALPDWREVLAVFAVKVAGSDGEDATDVATFDEDRVKTAEESVLGYGGGLG